MHRIAQVVTTVSLALWLGGLGALFLFVARLFQADRAVATSAAPVLFNSFAKYQLVLCVVGFMSALAMYFTSRSRWAMPIAACILAAGVAAVILQFSTIPEMERLRAAGEASGERFKKLHGLSSLYFVCEAIVLLIATVILPLAMGPRARTGRESSPATGSPA